MAKVSPLPLRALCALLVDDDPDVRETTREALEQLGLVVAEASHGLEAIQMFKADAWRPDLAVLDYNMPLMNGLDTLRALRSFQPDLPAILCSGSIGPDTLRESGLDRMVLLPKPFRLADLTKALVESLDSRAPRFLGSDQRYWTFP